MKENIEFGDSLIFSVLLVIKNEERYVGHLIEKLLHQDFPSNNYEIIIIDGMSTDGTREIVQLYMNENPNIKLLINEKETLPPGWNLGIQASRGEYVLRIDGHTEVPNDFLSNYWDIIKRKPDVACVGGIILSKGHGLQGEINEYVYSHPFGVGNSKFRTLTDNWEGYVDTVPYGAYKRQLFDKVGLFNEKLKRNEDLEFHKRLRDQGEKFYLSTKIRSIYFVRDTLKGLIDKSLGDGIWNIIANKATPGSLRIRHKIPLFAFVIGLILLVGAFLHPVLLSLLLLSVVSYLVLNAIFSYPIFKKLGLKSFVICILTFFCMHFFRGMGSFLAFFKVAYWKVNKV